MTRQRMQALRYPTEDIETVAELVHLHLRFHTYRLGWTDRAVRRYVRDAGPLLARLNELTRCDCTTRNAAKARALARRMDELEARIDELRRQEELDAIRPDLDGDQVMEHLGIAPGREVGRALAFLLELRLDEGPLGEEEAGRRLVAWWKEQARQSTSTAVGTPASGVRRPLSGRPQPAPVSQSAGQAGSDSPPAKASTIWWAVVVVVLDRGRLHEIGRRAEQWARRCPGRGRAWRSGRRR